MRRVLTGAGGMEEGGWAVGGVGVVMCRSRTVSDGRWVDRVCGGDIGGLLGGL